MPATRGPTSEPTSVLFSHVRLQTLFRILVASALLAGTVVVDWRKGLGTYDFHPLYWVIAFVFLTSIPASLLLGRIATERGLSRLALVQFLCDVAVTTALVYLTGGTDSLFTFLYGLTIINASIVLYRRGALLTAAAAAISFGLVVDLSYYGFLKPFAPDLVGGGDVTSREALYRVGVSTLGFFMTGVLASYLANVLRAQGIDLREQKALTKNIVDNLSSGLLTVDRGLTITSFNRGAEELTGRRLADVYGTELVALFPGVAQRIVGPEAPEPRRHEERFIAADGTSRVLGFSYSTLRNDDAEEIGTILIFQDLTELREMELRLKREERLAAVGRLAAGIAHEIRNPLASISGSIETLRGGLDLGPEDARLMGIILRETSRLDGLISDFLNYVKPVRQKMRRVDFGAVLQETADAIRSTDAGRQVEFALPPPSETLAVRGDPDHLKQVAWNLFLNASEAMGGKGRVEVRVLATRADRVTVEVADVGAGIDPETLPRVFEPFFTTKERGVGLGLAMVHKIVEGHGGNIEVDSEPGKGARFRMSLPRWHEGEPEARRVVDVG